MDLEKYLIKGSNSKLKVKHERGNFFRGLFSLDNNYNRRQLLVIVVYYCLVIFTSWFLFKNSKISLEAIQLVYALVFFGILPVFLIRKGFKDRLDEYNIPVGYLKKQIILTVAMVWLSSLLIWVFMLQWGGGIAKNKIWWNVDLLWLAIRSLVLIPIGLLIQEFFFRGVVLNILRKNFSNWLAMVVVSLLVVIFIMATTRHWISWYVGAGIVVFNILLSWVAIKLKSVVFSFWLYWWGLILLNFWVLWQISSKIN